MTRLHCSTAKQMALVTWCPQPSRCRPAGDGVCTDRTRTGPRPVPMPAAGLQERSPCCARCPGNPHRSLRALGPLPAAQLCVHLSRGSPVKGRVVKAAMTAAVTVTAALLPQSLLPVLPIQCTPCDWGGQGLGNRSAAATLRGLGRDQEMVQDRLTAAWCVANYSCEFGDVYKAYDDLPAQPAGSATPKGTERTWGGEWEKDRRTLEMKIPSCEAFPPRMLKPNCERNQQ